MDLSIMEHAISVSIISARSAMISNIEENAKNRNFLLEILSSTAETTKNMPKMRRRNRERRWVSSYVMPSL